MKIKSYKIKFSFVSPEGLKARANKTCIDNMIFTLICVEIVCNTMLYIVFQYGEPVLIQRIVIGFEAILDKLLKIRKQSERVLL